MRGRSWIRQTSSNAWTPMNLDVMITETKLASRRQMMKPEMKLTKKVTADEEGTEILGCQELWPRNLEMLSVGDSTSLCGF